MIIARAVSSFAAWPQQDVLPWLKTPSYHEMIALSAVKALHGQDRTDAVPAIRQWLTAANPPVQQRDLGRVLETIAFLSRDTGDQQLQPFLAGYLSDHRQNVRRSAARALGQLADPRSLPALRGLASVKLDSAAADASEAIAKIEASLTAPVQTQQAWKKVEDLTKKTEELQKKLEKLESRAKPETGQTK
jgi:HEAT repeat protein